MSNSGVDAPDSPEADQMELDAKRFNVLVTLIALGALGGFLFMVYKAVASFTKAAEEAESAFGIFAPPRRKASRKAGIQPRRTASSRSVLGRPSATRPRSVGLLARSLTGAKASR